MTAVRDGDDWVMNGTKTFICKADRADFVIVFAVDRPRIGARRRQRFLIDSGTPGFEVVADHPDDGRRLGAGRDVASSTAACRTRNWSARPGDGLKLADQQLCTAA